MASAAGSPLDGAASPSADGWGAVAADSDEDLGAGDDAGDLLSDEELEDVPALAQRDLGPPDSSSSDDDGDDAPPEIDLPLPTPHGALSQSRERRQHRLRYRYARSAASHPICQRTS